MKTSAIVGPSRRLDHWMRSSRFRDTLAVRSTATPEQLLQAFEGVTLHEMPLGRFLGFLRVQLDEQPPFLVLERASDELVVGRIGKLHQIRDQEPVDIRTPDDFAVFDEPGYEKLVVSVRTVRVVAGTLLVLEHRTEPLGEEALVRFARHWRLVRRVGAFVTRQLLEAAVRRAERPPAPMRVRARRRLHPA